MLILVLLLIIVTELLLLWKRNHVFLLEALAIWMVAAVVNQNLLGIVSMNMKLIELTPQIQMFWANALNRVVVIPLLIVILIDVISTIRTRFNQIIIVLSGIILLSFGDYMVAWVGMIKLIQWNFGFSFVIWFICVGVALMISRWFQFSLKKEGYIQ
jgi:hypothetical protein